MLRSRSMLKKPRLELGDQYIVTIGDNDPMLTPVAWFLRMPAQFLPEVLPFLLALKHVLSLIVTGPFVSCRH